MDYYEKNGHTAFKSDSGTEYYLPEPAAFDDIPNFTLTSRNGENDCRCYYECDERNEKGERMVVELVFCENFDGTAQLPNLWKKSGHIDRVLTSYWSLNTFVYDERGNCRGAYNPQEMVWHSKPDSEGHIRVHHVIDFDWKFEATRENALALFDECHRRFMAMEPMHEAEEGRYKQ